MAQIPGNLKKIVEESVQDFLKDTTNLDSYNLKETSFSLGETTAAEYASILGFSGEKMKGSVVISCQRPLLDKSHPNHSMGMPVSEPDFTDWAGEITNQTLGRIKNKLATAGVSFA